MRYVASRWIMLALLVALAGSTAGVAAQDDSTLTEITVEVLEDPGLLFVSAAYTSLGTPIFREGGLSEGRLQIRVVDTRLSGPGWYVEGRIGALTSAGPSAPTYPTRFSLILVSTEPTTVVGTASPVLSSETGPSTFTRLLESTRQSGLATWDTTLLVPPGLDPGSYHAALLLNLYSGDPP